MDRTDIITIICFWRSVWGYLAMYVCPREYRQKIVEEQKWWQKHLTSKNYSGFMLFSQLVRCFPEYVNLYCYRMSKCNIITKVLGRIAMLLFPQQSTLFLTSADIGWNLIIQHGFSTVVSAKRIGENCWINQQVTIGYTFDKEPPTIGNGCIICSGAKVVGNVLVGDNAIVGANAVVTHDVAPNDIVGGVPAKPIGKNNEHILF